MNHGTHPIAVPILLVDDRPDNLLTLEAPLSDQGYELIKASSGNEALLLTLKHDTALVLLDVQMPDMDGFETAELMRANPKTCHIPIIFVTAGMKDLQFQFNGYDVGAVDYLTKPIEPVILQSKVKIFAELYRQRHEIELHKNNLESLVTQRTIELRQVTSELKDSNEQLQHQNNELKSTESLLRNQVIEFVETHDQLLATEEMLRIQIGEYEIAQKLLRESNTSLQTLFDVSPLGIVVSSFSTGLILEINNTFTELFGYTDNDVIGKTGLEIGLWVDNSERERFIWQMNEQQGISGFSAEIKNVRGEARLVLLYSNIMDFKNEKCILIVFLDITEQRRLEDQIRQTQKMDVIGQLAGGIAHDFNNMLTAIIGSSELLDRHTRDNPPAAKLLATIKQAAIRSAELTGQLLAFSRKGQKNSVPVQVDTTIHDVISLLARTIDKNINLEMQLLAKNSCVIGDPALLQNALLNLGVNARDAMPKGGVITFSTRNVELDALFCRYSSFTIAPGSYIQITVSDTGCGMTKEIVQHVFEPFYTTKEVGKGTGLGLAAVYGTITDHHGCINIYSEPGIGTEFKIYLPLSQINDTEIKCSEELVHGTGGVLLVDDEAILRDVGQALLEGLGYKVFLAENGEQALEIYEREKSEISLVILDMLMPGMGGRRALVRLKENYPDIKIIVSSGFHAEETVNELLELGAVAFLQKPYLLQELCKTVAEAIGG